MRRRLCLAAPVLLMSACSAKLIRPSSIALCRQGHCETISDAESRGRLLSGLHDLLRQAKGKEIALFSSDPGSRSQRKRGVSFFVQGGPIPGRSTISELRVNDVLYIDREKSETKARLKLAATYVGVPLLCSESGAAFTVSPEQTAMTFSNVCTWIGLGTTLTKFEWLIDRVDLDSGVASGHWSVRTAGLPVLGGGSGYLVARFHREPQPPAAASPQPQSPVPHQPPPEPPKTPAPAPPPAATSEEVVSETSSLSLATEFKDENGDRILNGGETIHLRVAAANAGKAVAGQVQAVLSGEPSLVDCLGLKRDLGVIPAGGDASADFDCRLPAKVPSETVGLKIELVSGPKATVAAAKLLRIGMKSAAAPVEEEVVSELNVDEIPSKSKDAGARGNVAVVIGLSHYREKAIPSVKYAARDAEVMARYLENVAGVSAENLKLLTDDSATKSDLEAYFEDWLPRRAGPQSTVFVYYAGHGAPDPAGKEAFLVPYEGHPDFPSKLYPLKRLYEALAKLPSKAAIVMLDSCFSGAKGRGVAQEGARPLVLSTRNAFAPAGRTSVLAGAAGSQIASDLDAVEHGLFTYYLLKGLRGEADADRDGAVDLGELFSFARDNVSKKASAALNRDQVPVLLGDAAADSKIPLAHR